MGNEKITLTKKDIIIGIVVLIVLLFMIIGIPILINYLMYWNIETNNSSDGEWLSFWGSFLGGILGGICTLGGVMLTLYKSDKDRNREKKEEKEERKPRLIPLKKQLFAIIKNDQIIISNDTINIIDTYTTSEHPEIKIVNASKESAIDVEMQWREPSKRMIKCTDLSQDEKDLLINFIDEFKEHRDVINEIEFIPNLGESIISVHSYLLIYIEEMLKLLLKVFNERQGKIFLKYNIPLGELELRSKNVYYDNANNRYHMYMSIFSEGTNLERYMVRINFVLIKDNNESSL